MAEKQTKQSDFYQILGVTQEATPEEIYEKYLKLSLLYHPDKGGDAEKYKLVNMAYKVLKNPENRSKYNASLATTFMELKEVKRDTQYHTNEEYLGEDKKFNHDKFLSEFEKKRPDIEETKGIKPLSKEEFEQSQPKKTLEQIMKERDAELFGFKKEQYVPDMFDPKNRPDEFNHVFNTFKNRHNREIDEYGGGGFAPVDFGPGSALQAGMLNPVSSRVDFRDKVSQILNEVKYTTDIPSMTNQPKATPEDWDIIQAKRKMLDEELTKKELQYEEFNDTDKLVLDDLV
jgi:curved DNA-binding protein CbpA